MIRFYIVIAMHDGAVLGIHCDASDEGSRADLWDRGHDEVRLCHDLLDGDCLPEPGPGPGMLCICGEVKDATMGDGGSMLAPESPAPVWRRPSPDELSSLVLGETPPTVTAWLEAAQ